VAITLWFVDQLVHKQPSSRRDRLRVYGANHRRLGVSCHATESRVEASLELERCRSATVSCCRHRQNDLRHLLRLLSPKLDRISVLVPSISLVRYCVFVLQWGIVKVLWWPERQISATLPKALSHAYIRRIFNSCNCICRSGTFRSNLLLRIVWQLTNKVTISPPLSIGAKKSLPERARGVCACVACDRAGGVFG